jgi:hypothetical protein
MLSPRSQAMRVFDTNRVSLFRRAFQRFYKNREALF